MQIKAINPNYSAVVVKVDRLVELEGCDNVVGFPIFGYQAIVSKETKVGDLGIIFTAETQLTEEYCMWNNLYRDNLMNNDTNVKGYIEQNRRVKAMKFRGHKSSALFMPLSSLGYLGKDYDTLEIGNSFDTVNGTEICRKYETFTRISKGNRVKGKNKTFIRVEAKNFPEHLDTENYFRNKQFYKDDDVVTVTQKLHGTSGRFGNIKTKRKLGTVEKLLKLIGIKINEHEYDYIAGSRRVIKDIKTNQEQIGYYESDLWNATLEKYKNTIPKNYIIYGEIIGRDGEKPIQKDYTYHLPVKEHEMYVYRISIVNDDGIACDLTYHQMEEFCKNNGLNIVPLLREGLHKDFIAEERLDKNFLDSGFLCVPLCKESPCDEGVVIRKEGLQPYVTKAKSPEFLEKETKDLDKGIVDLESLQSNETNEEDNNV